MKIIQVPMLSNGQYGSLRVGTVFIMTRTPVISSIAIAGLFWLAAETPAMESGYELAVSAVHAPMQFSGEIAEYPLGFELPISQTTLDDGQHCNVDDARPVFWLASVLDNLRDPSESALAARPGGLFRAISDDDADLYKRANRRPEVRRRERKPRSAWMDWLLSWSLDLIAVLTAAEISATIVARAL
jgi:hypothetical protein